MQSLLDIAAWILQADEVDLSMKTICARQPLTADSEATVVALDEESQLPATALAGGLKYFLEAYIAREVLAVLRKRSTNPTPEEACKLLIHYAENDAYPAWVYQ